MSNVNTLSGLALTPKVARQIASSFATKAIVECQDSEGNSVSLRIAKNTALELFAENPNMVARVENLGGTRTVKGEQIAEDRGTLILSL